MSILDRSLASRAFGPRRTGGPNVHILAERGPNRDKNGEALDCSMLGSSHGFFPVSAASRWVTSAGLTLYP